MSYEHEYYQLSLKVIMKNNKGEVLGLGGLPDGIFAGFYDFPGGRVSKGEFSLDFSEVIKREIIEELGDIKYEISSQPVAVGKTFVPASRTRSGKDINVLYLFFEAAYLGGDIVISEEHIDYRWIDVKKEDLDKLFLAGNLEGIKMYLEK